MIDNSCGLSFYGQSCLLWLVFPFMDISVIDEYSIKILATIFSP